MVAITYIVGGSYCICRVTVVYVEVGFVFVRVLLSFAVVVSVILLAITRVLVTRVVLLFRLALLLHFDYVGVVGVVVATIV